jgi:hypothetical protein
MDAIVLKAYQELLKVGKITKDNVYSHVIQNRITAEDYTLIIGEEFVGEIPIPLPTVEERMAALEEALLALMGL